MKQMIRLRGISGDIKGKVWEHDTILRAGRLGSLEIVLDDSSVSRQHAELHGGATGWIVRDLQSTNGTFVNGMRLAAEDRPLHSRDIVQFGKVAMIVELNDSGSSAGGQEEQMLVEATSHQSWEEAFVGLAFDRNRCPRPGEQLLAMLRAGHHLVHLESETELLHSILNDAVAVLDAQRGAIVLADNENKLQLKALAGDSSGRFHFSQKLALRCFQGGESILCGSVEDDPELKLSQSIADGAMASVMCVLLRTPRRRLGVLHLDRNFWQKPFTEDDLHLADALAANVSMGIECSQLMRKQRDLFLNTITVLAQAVELRDEYTGGHTARVTNYTLLLAQQLNLSHKDQELLRIGTPLHDIGKIGIDDAILRKPGRLTPEEFKVMQSHTVKGDAIVSTIPDLHVIRPIVRSHHERWDGKGYPDRLAGEQIPLLARIVAVADAFDAMTSNRPYHIDKKGKSPEAAFEEVEAMAGHQFDPSCAAAFLEIRDQVLESMATLRQTSVFHATAQV
jgi:HD-GYP domain-containing protein (c-di-GMP phosphodiesterase class II)/pSer/pThr/pTyr-binding forkhead associated (FHA) protein